MQKIDFSNVKKAGIDIDDVVLEFAWSFLDFCNRKYRTSFLFEEVKTCRLDKAVGISSEESRTELDEFFSSKDFKKVDLMDSAKENIEALAENFGIFDFEIVHYTDSDDVDSLQDLVDKGSKGKVCKDYGFDIMFKDNVNHAEDCANKGIKFVLFDKPWDREKEAKDNLIRTNGWKDVLNELNLNLIN